MFELFKSVLSPIVSLILVMLGNTFFSTYLSVRMDTDGISNQMIGLVMSSYFGGFIIGSLFIEKLIAKIGHIRSFSVFASLLTTCMMLQGIFLSPEVWILLRLLGGICGAGLYIVVESWLLVLSSDSGRGQVLSWYMVSLYSGQSLSQFILNAVDIESFVPFCVAAILCSLSVVPVCMNRVDCPAHEHVSTTSLKKIYNSSPFGVIACFLSGTMLSCVYGLLPIFARDNHFSVSQTAMLMGMTLMGGFALQWPIGYLSDYYDRRRVLLSVSFVSICVCAFIFTTCTWLPVWLTIIFCTLFGGLIFSLYPLGISQVCDHLETKDLVAATGILLLVYGCGSVIGPLIAPYLMNVFPKRGLFVFMTLQTSLLWLFGMWRSAKSESIPLEEQLDHITLPSTTVSVGELSPVEVPPEEE